MNVVQKAVEKTVVELSNTTKEMHNWAMPYVENTVGESFWEEEEFKRGGALTTAYDASGKRSSPEVLNLLMNLHQFCIGVDIMLVNIFELRKSVERLGVTSMPLLAHGDFHIEVGKDCRLKVAISRDATAEDCYLVNKALNRLAMERAGRMVGYKHFAGMEDAA
jgi:hypothetical protein